MDSVFGVNRNRAMMYLIYPIHALSTMGEKNVSISSMGTMKTEKSSALE